MKKNKIISFILLLLIKFKLNLETPYIDIDYEDSVKKPQDSKLIRIDEIKTYIIKINKEDLKNFFLEFNLMHIWILYHKMIIL